MIISHKMKMIFIAVRKTASSTLEKRLSRYCGEGDVVSHPEVEIYKANICTDQYNGEYFRDKHMCADEIKSKIPEDIWNNYLKVSTVRCPWDTLISLYFFTHFCSPKYADKNFNMFALRDIESIVDNYLMLCVNNQLAVDFLIRYENFNEDVKNLESKINCPGLLDSIENNEKWNTVMRPPGQDVYSIYTQYPIARAIVDKYFTMALENEFIQKYYPVYKKNLDQRIQKLGYFSKIVAGFMAKNRGRLLSLSRFYSSLRQDVGTINYNDKLTGEARTKACKSYTEKFILVK